MPDSFLPAYAVLKQQAETENQQFLQARQEGRQRVAQVAAEQQQAQQQQPESQQQEQAPGQAPTSSPEVRVGSRCSKGQGARGSGRPGQSKAL